MSEDKSTVGIPFPQFIQLYRDYSPQELEKKVATGFLLVSRARLDAKEDSDAINTIVGTDKSPPMRKTLREMIVYPIRKHTTNTPDKVITVGRLDNCDLVLDHSSMSRVHAYFRLDANGRIESLVDADSLNGTRVNHEPLEANRPRRLQAGDAVNFGKAFGSSYHTPESIHEYVRNFRDFL